jgi:hypothetical protein
MTNGPVRKLLILYACLYVWFLISLFFSHQKNYPTHNLRTSVSSIVSKSKTMTCGNTLCALLAGHGLACGTGGLLTFAAGNDT